MRRRILLAFAVSTAGVAACADILGIDDGIPRTGDAALDVTVSDAAPDVRDGSSDAKPDAPFTPLFCGTSNTCNFAAGEGCCRTGGATYACVDAAASCTGMFIPCDRPSECPQNTEAGAMECCTNDVVNDSGVYVAQSVGCVPVGKCSPIPSHYILCDTDAACPPEAGCGQSVSALPPFLICK